MDVSLPLGLPWIGARFHLDALAAVFVIVVALGGAAASLYALGYGRHEAEPERVLPFYPVFLAGMILVQLETPLEAVMRLAERAWERKTPLMLDPAPARALWREHLSGGRNHAYQLWTLLSFEAWRRRWA